MKLSQKNSKGGTQGCLLPLGREHSRVSGYGVTRGIKGATFAAFPRVASALAPTAEECPKWRAIVDDSVREKKIHIFLSGPFCAINDKQYSLIEIASAFPGHVKRPAVRHWNRVYENLLLSFHDTACLRSRYDLLHKVALPHDLGHLPDELPSPSHTFSRLNKGQVEPNHSNTILKIWGYPTLECGQAVGVALPCPSDWLRQPIRTQITDSALKMPPGDLWLDHCRGLLSDLYLYAYFERLTATQEAKQKQWLTSEDLLKGKKTDGVKHRDPSLWGLMRQKKLMSSCGCLYWTCKQNEDGLVSISTDFLSLDQDKLCYIERDSASTQGVMQKWLTAEHSKNGELKSFIGSCDEHYKSIKPNSGDVQELTLSKNGNRLSIAMAWERVSSRFLHLIDELRLRGHLFCRRMISEKRKPSLIENPSRQGAPIAEQELLRATLSDDVIWKTANLSIPLGELDLNRALAAGLNLRDAYELALNSIASFNGFELKSSDRTGPLKALVVFVDKEATVIVNHRYKGREKVRLAMHELGHIKLNHRANSDYGFDCSALDRREVAFYNMQEDEADRFALCCLKIVDACIKLRTTEVTKP